MIKALNVSQTEKDQLTQQLHSTHDQAEILKDEIIKMEALLDSERKDGHEQASQAIRELATLKKAHDANLEEMTRLVKKFTMIFE